MLISYKKQIKELKKALRWLVEHEDNSCRFDHHGYCQEHSGGFDYPCATAYGRSLLGLSHSELLTSWKDIEGGMPG